MPTLDNVPGHVLEQVVLPFIHPQEWVTHVARVSRRWRGYTQNSRMWRHAVLMACGQAALDFVSSQHMRISDEKKEGADAASDGKKEERKSVSPPIIITDSVPTSKERGGGGGGGVDWQQLYLHLASSLRQLLHGKVKLEDWMVMYQQRVDPHASADTLAHCILHFRLPVHRIAQALTSRPEAQPLFIAILRRLPFQSLRIDWALRALLGVFHLPNSSGAIDRCLEAFSQAYALTHNPEATQDTFDKAYMMCFALMMVSSDLHNQRLREHITWEQWRLNMQGFDEAYLTDMFATTSQHPFGRITHTECQGVLHLTVRGIIYNSQLALYASTSYGMLRIAADEQAAREQRWCWQLSFGDEEGKKRERRRRLISEGMWEEAGDVTTSFTVAHDKTKNAMVIKGPLQRAVVPPQLQRTSPAERALTTVLSKKAAAAAPVLELQLPMEDGGAMGRQWASALQWNCMRHVVAAFAPMLETV